MPEELRADGSRRVQLDDRFAEFAVVTLGANGQPVFTCFHGPAAARAAALRTDCPPDPPAPVVDR